jgi:hypothetical protein
MISGHPRKKWLLALMVVVAVLLAAQFVLARQGLARQADSALLGRVRYLSPDYYRLDKALTIIQLLFTVAVLALSMKSPRRIGSTRIFVIVASLVLLGLGVGTLFVLSNTMELGFISMQHSIGRLEEIYTAEFILALLAIIAAARMGSIE